MSGFFFCVNGVFDPAGRSFSSRIARTTTDDPLYCPASGRIYIRGSAARTLAWIDTADWSVSPDYTLTGFNYATNTLTSNARLSPDGALLALYDYTSLAGDSRIKIYRTSDWVRVGANLSFPESCDILGFSPDGSLFLAYRSGASNIEVYSTADWSLVTGFPTIAYTDYYSPINTQYFFSGPNYSRRLLRWSDYADVTPSSWDTPAGYRYITPSPGGTYFAVCRSAWESDSKKYAYVTLYRQSDFTQVGATLVVFSSGSYNEVDASIVFLPSDEYFIAYSYSDNTVGARKPFYAKVYRTADQELVYTFTTTDTFPTLFSADSAYGLLPKGSTPYYTVYRTSDWSILPAGLPLPDNNYNDFIPLPSDVALPTLSVAVQDHTGAPVASVPIDIYKRSNNATRITTATTSAAGAWAYSTFDQTEHQIVISDNRSGATKDYILRLTPSMTVALPSVITLPALSGLVALSGNATVIAGGPVDAVVILDWTTSELVARVEPETDGDWTANVVPGTYAIVYLADGCAPAAHGPYTAA